MDIDISVVIPAYNSAQMISETINSIVDQTLLPSEIIVVDDGSTDDTERVVAQYGEKVKYVKIENSGVCKARNVGVSMANSKWIAFCDHDDLWCPEKLYFQADLVCREPKVEYCFTNFRLIENDLWKFKDKFIELPSDYWDVSIKNITYCSFIVDEPLYCKVIMRQPIFPSTIMLTKDFFYKIGGFDESFGRKMSEDLEFTLRCVQECPIGVVTVPVVGIRKHGDNFSRGKIPGFSHIVGDVDILKYSLENHRLGQGYQAAITEQIIKRSIDATHGAFAYGDYKIMETMLENIPSRRRAIKLWVKILMLRLPSPVAKILMQRDSLEA